MNVTSIAGRIATPNQIAYSTCKHALAAASKALAHEVAAFGIRVAIIEPGVVQTAIFENSAGATRYDKTSPYRQIIRRNGKLFAAGFRDPGQPETVATAILEAITTDRPRLRYPVASTRRAWPPAARRISDEEWVAMGGGLLRRGLQRALQALLRDRAPLVRQRLSSSPPSRCLRRKFSSSRISWSSRLLGQLLALLARRFVVVPLELLHVLAGGAILGHRRSHWVRKSLMASAKPDMSRRRSSRRAR